MLKKLFKYDFKALGALMLPVYAATLIVGLVSGFSTRYSKMTHIFDKGYAFSVNSTFSAIMTALYIMLFAATCILCVILSITRFRKNLLGKEGYITNTLPVPTSKHIWSKVLNASLWQIITVIFAIISAVITILIAYGNPVFPSLRELWRALMIFMQRIDGYSMKLGITFVLQLLGYAICAVIILMAKNLMFYASLAIGHIANDKKVLKSFAAYIVLYLASQTVNVIGINCYLFIAKLFNFNFNSSDFFGSFWYIFIPLLLYSVFYFAVYFIITNTILKKKLNLE